MTMQPDKLFRDKLENFQLDTSHGAWSRVETGLESSPSGALWIKIGAAVLLLTVSSVLIWNYTNPNHQNQIVNQIQVHEKENPLNESQTNTPKENIVSQVSPTADKKQITKTIRPAKFNHPSTDITEPNIVDAIDKNNMQENIPARGDMSHPNEIAIPDVASTISSQNLVEKTTPVYIVYKAEDVNKKYLRKQPKPDTISSEKKLSAFQTIAGIAYNVKTGENGIGNLREMKDEIFTLSFLDEKKNKN